MTAIQFKISHLHVLTSGASTELQTQIKVFPACLKKPNTCCFKYNFDGASRGNPVLSSIAFCIRNHSRNLVFSIACQVPDTTSIDIEVMVIAIGCGYSIEYHLLPLLLEIRLIFTKKDYGR